ncbi:MAG: AraC family transcriptional regulator, partial [bacterium]|nr:AraC family transcriptional regulator [bacterium]
MVKNQLPFRFYEVSAVHPEPFQVGGTVSVFDLCGVYLCCEGEVCFSSDDHTYTMHRGDLYIYLPSSVVHLKQLSADSRGLVMDARIDFALPISNKVMNSENLLCLRQHPTLHLTDEQFDYLQRLMLRIGKRIQWEEVRQLPVARQHLMMELMKSLGHVVFYEVLNLYFASEVKDPVPNDRKDLIFQNFM